MAKLIKYKFLSCEINHGTEDEPKIEQIFLDAEIECKTEADYQANLPIVEKEAYNGEYTVEDDGQQDEQPSSEERIAELEEALSMLLSGVTE